MLNITIKYLVIGAWCGSTVELVVFLQLLKVEPESCFNELICGPECVQVQLWLSLSSVLHSQCLQSHISLVEIIVLIVTSNLSPVRPFISVTSDPSSSEAKLQIFKGKHFSSIARTDLYLTLP